MAIRNEWVDEYGDTYVIYPKQEMKKYLNISRYRIDQALAELEEHDQMVEVTVPYPGKLCQFYVKDITDNEKQMKKMKESNEENFCGASGCGYARWLLYFLRLSFCILMKLLPYLGSSDINAFPAR